ncbi:site-specific DNA-methyltransferase, partial [Rossellomorea sp. BNER]|uniref:site-specific DNA-methyltransferase n=1 Tax=Rossellomorea sp. BNER TaxID=2962031 RepID=UPI003AF2F4F6|nr:site-specific DNA-methyltransferase [Rossellomorea sp. BNER]
MEVKLVKAEDINPAPYNPRKDLKPGDDEYEKLKRSIEEFGYVDLMIWNKRTGNLVGGHQRFKILVNEMGYTEVHVSVVDLDDHSEKSLNLALNKISGDWDEEKLYELLNELQENQDIDISLTGFEESEAKEFLDSHFDKSLPNIEDIEEDDFNVEEAYEEAEKEPITQKGDIWLLGNHRLMCGDSTKEDDVKRLMDGKLASMIFTDPPYNVNYSGGTKDKLTIDNDNMDSESFYKFLSAAYKNMANSTKEGGAIYVCHADAEWNSFRSGLIDNGFLLKQCLIWVKNSFTLSRSDYHWQHEPILYGWKEGAAHTWNGDRLQTTVIYEESSNITITKEKDYSILTFKDGELQITIKVSDFEILSATDEESSSIWKVNKPNRNADHPTMKPIALPARAIRNSSVKDDIVIDLFGGSGSTLIAAEQTGRKCYTMEYSPVYCDVIVRRYEEL